MKSGITKILITGSSGTIGTRLFERLLEQGYQVVGFDRKKNRWYQHLDALTITGDLLKEKDIKKLPKGTDLIIHLAANARVYDLVVDPDLALENITTTYHVLEFARKNNIKKVIFASSREAYGNKKEIVSKETDLDIERCESPYAASKISDEALIYAYAKCYEIDYIICRLSNIYGMYDDSNRFIPLVMQRLRKDEDVKIFGKDKVLDFTYIDDCVTGLTKCIERFFEVKNNVFNIASGKGTNLVEVAKIIKENLKSQSKIMIGKNRKGEVVKYIADISKAKKMLNYIPNISMVEGIALSIDWYLKNTNA